MDNIPLKNFTRYDTDDLQKLVNHVAAAVAELTQEAAVLRSGVQRVEFHEYTPASADQVVKTWNMHKNEYDEQLVRKFVGPEVRTRPERIALLAPKLIWKNPLEALISSTDGEESVPANMLENISRAVISVFNFSIWQHTREGRGMNLRLDEHRVRVRKTVGAKVGGDDKKREKLRYVLIVLDPLTGSGAQALAQLRRRTLQQEHGGVVAAAFGRQRDGLPGTGEPVAVRSPEVTQQPAVLFIRDQSVAILSK